MKPDNRHVTCHNNRLDFRSWSPTELVSCVRRSLHKCMGWSWEGLELFSLFLIASLNLRLLKVWDSLGNRLYPLPPVLYFFATGHKDSNIKKEVATTSPSHSPPSSSSSGPYLQALVPMLMTLKPSSSPEVCSSKPKLAQSWNQNAAFQNPKEQGSVGLSCVVRQGQYHQLIPKQKLFPLVSCRPAFVLIGCTHYSHLQSKRSYWAIKKHALLNGYTLPSPTTVFNWFPLPDVTHERVKDYPHRQNPCGCKNRTWWLSYASSIQISPNSLNTDSVFVFCFF